MTLTHRGKRWFSQTPTNPPYVGVRHVHEESLLDQDVAPISNVGTGIRCRLCCERTFSLPVRVVTIGWSHLRVGVSNCLVCVGGLITSCGYSWRCRSTRRSGGSFRSKRRSLGGENRSIRCSRVSHDWEMVPQPQDARERSFSADENSGLTPVPLRHIGDTPVNLWRGAGMRESLRDSTAKRRRWPLRIHIHSCGQRASYRIHRLGVPLRNRLGSGRLNLWRVDGTGVHLLHSSRAKDGGLVLPGGSHSEGIRSHSKVAMGRH
jgi:hypothetical protein